MTRRHEPNRQGMSESANSDATVERRRSPVLVEHTGGSWQPLSATLPEEQVTDRSHPAAVPQT